MKIIWGTNMDQVIIDKGCDVDCILDQLTAMDLGFA